MFTGFERSALRDWLIVLARADTEVTAAAVLGSGADVREDQWSDIDLALRLAPGQDPAAVANRWSKRLGERVQPIAHMDLWSVDPEGAQPLAEVLAELVITSVPALPDDTANL